MVSITRHPNVNRPKEIPVPPSMYAQRLDFFSNYITSIKGLIEFATSLLPWAKQTKHAENTIRNLYTSDIILVSLYGNVLRLIKT
jgi:hypothetical protein